MNSIKKPLQALIFIGALFLLNYDFVNAQQLHQTLRGKIIDQDSKSALIGANVIIEGSDPILGSSTDIDGEFRIEHVPIGRVNLIITSIGYEDKYLPNMQIGTGKELLVNVQMVESIVQMDEIVVSEKSHKSEVLDHGKCPLVFCRGNQKICGFI